MSPELLSLVAETIANLPRRSIVRKGKREFEVRSLILVSGWRKEGAYVIGEDSCGNNYRRHLNGSIWFWDHEKETEEILFSSVPEFLAALSAPTAVMLQPGQVKRVWIDPAFLEEQRRKKNA